jgi:HEAT repeat protein
MRSEDSRVRANAIEAVWFHQTPESAAIFRNALSDPCHRVVVNALVGLYYQNDETALETLISLTRHPAESFRAAAVWAFGHIYDDRAIKPLMSLVDDDSEVIREKAARVLAKLLYVRDWITSRFR